MAPRSSRARSNRSSTRSRRVATPASSPVASRFQSTGVVSRVVGRGLHDLAEEVDLPERRPQVVADRGEELDGGRLLFGLAAPAIELLVGSRGGRAAPGPRGGATRSPATRRIDASSSASQGSASRIAWGAAGPSGEAPEVLGGAPAGSRVRPSSAYGARGREQAIERASVPPVWARTGSEGAREARVGHRGQVGRLGAEAPDQADEPLAVVRGAGVEQDAMGAVAMAAMRPPAPRAEIPSPFGRGPTRTMSV